VPLLLAPGPALAGETPWQEVAPGVSLRLISTGQIKADGTTLFGLQIDMPENTKTYWRVPGDTGLPTQLDLSASRGVTGHAILWPLPVRDQSPDYLDYAYFGETVLPIEIATTGPDAEVDLVATLGVCSDICVPAQARFALPAADAAPDRANGLRIRQALATVPLPWPGDPQPIGDVELLPDGQSIAVRISDPALDPQSLIAATEGGYPLFGTPQKSPQPDLVVLPILGKTDNSALNGMDVQLTFMTGMGAFEIRRTIRPAETRE